MTPVMQSKLFCKDGIHSGNCYAACLASMLDLPLWMVPPFEDMFASHAWDQRVDDWLERFFGLELDMCRPDEIPAEPHLAWGRSARDVSHMVIYQGDTLLHDPHPSGSGIIKVEGRQKLVKVS
jgi:hypothetical protein